MGDMADWIIDQGMGYEAQVIESQSKARNLSDAEIVELLEGVEYSDEQVLPRALYTKVQSICSWY